MTCLNFKGIDCCWLLIQQIKEKYEAIQDESAQKMNKNTN